MISAGFVATTLIDCPWAKDDMARALNAIDSRQSRRAARLATALVKQFAQPPSLRTLRGFLIRHAGFRQFCERARLVDVAALMEFKPGRSVTDWNLPNFAGEAELAFWLGLSWPWVQWLANELKPHYVPRLVRKRVIGWRLVESPKPRLTQVQRLIAHQILNRIPPHSAAHGFVVGRSAMTFVQSHVAKDFVLWLDLKDFFPSVDPGRVFGVFRQAGYPYHVCRLDPFMYDGHGPVSFRRGSGLDRFLGKDPIAIAVPSSSPATRRTDVASIGQLGRIPFGLSAGWFGGSLRRELFAIR